MAPDAPLAFRWLESDAQLLDAFDLMRELRGELERGGFVAAVRAIQAVNGYRMAGGFSGDRLVCLAGVHRNHGLSRGPHLRVDDLVVARDGRGRGFGREMLRFLAREAKRQGVPSLLLDARDEAKPFYSRLGFDYRRSTPCSIPVERLLG